MSNKKEKHDDREHATLSPSSAERWFNCPGSIRLIGDRKSISGAAAIEGTLAHEYASDILLGEASIENIPDENMREAVQRYMEFVDDLERGYDEDPEYLIEERVDLTHLGGDCWGTADYASWVVGDELYVIDYKHGIRPVEAKNNKQTLIYAVGVCEEIGYDFKYIYTVIVQPRAAHMIGPIRSCRYPPESLIKFRDNYLKQAIKETQNDRAPIKAGPWCEYCPAIGDCPAFVGRAQELAKIEFGNAAESINTALPDVKTITDDQLSLIVQHSRAFHAWLQGCQDEAVLRLSNGRDVCGLKLVRSPGRSKWRDNATDALYDDERFWEERLITITEARKVAKEEWDDPEELEQYIEKPEGKIVAVPELDGRPLYISAKVEFDEQE